MKKSSKENLQEKSNNAHKCEYLILGEYINNQTKIEIKHLKCGCYFEILSNNHLKGKGGCPSCFKKNKISKEELQEKSNRIHNKEYEILGDYINTNTKIEIKHLKCGSIFQQTPDKHLRKNKCPICFGNNRLSVNILQERSDKKYGKGEYKILGEYVNNSTPILVKHLKCGSEYMQIPNNHLKRKCSNCFGTPKKSNIQIQLESNKIHNSEYVLIGNYCGANNQITLKHKTCGKEFKIIAFSHLKGSKCIYCHNSKGENRIEEILKNKGIEFINGKSFDGCKSKNKLRFDFYLPKYNTCIEYDGIQHFKPIEWFGGIDSFTSNKERDEIKNKWCVDNDINLIRISYKEDIEDKLNSINA